MTSVEDEWNKYISSSVFKSKYTIASYKNGHRRLTDYIGTAIKDASQKDIIEAVKVAKEKITRSEVKKKETEILYEDERWSVLIPLSTRSSNLYGKSTKWCVSSEDHNYGKYFKQYTENGVLIFLIDKNVKEKECFTNNLSKVAFHNDKSKLENGITLWDVKDKSMNISDTMKVYSMVGGDIMDIINKRLEEGPTNKEQAKSKGVRE